MTSHSEIKRGPGRPVGVKNGQGVKKKPVKKPKVRINTEAILANSEVKKLTAEVSSLKVEVEKLRSAYIGAELQINATEKKYKAALIVIGYLEGKIFQS